jgi:hypothetical protein
MRDMQAGRVPSFPTWEDFKRTMVEFFHPTGLEMQARMDLRRLRRTGRVQVLLQDLPAVGDPGALHGPRHHSGHVCPWTPGPRPDLRPAEEAPHLLEAIETAETYEVSTEEDHRGGRAHRPPRTG